jgi:23S rRNA (adenine-N6)-dimethyltransferase
MRNRRRKLLSQNFLQNPDLVSRLVNSSSIGTNDLVLEIGPGGGIITRALIKKASQVVAVELDPDWYARLKKVFFDTSNLLLYKEDFLSFSLPRLPYKVFANIPFAIEGKIIRKLIEARNPPQDCYLVLVHSLARRLAARDKENMFSLMHKPWFEFAIIYRFSPHDFSPAPSLAPVLFRFTMKKKPLLHFAERSRYQKFIQRGFKNGESIRNNLRNLFPVQKVDVVLHKLFISKKTKPTQLTLEQWIDLYRTFFQV